jgi:NADH:ubiquinone oxidoreductase subunit F (NADH-binding)/NADH:ubiquinone oxidoreductase subunit E
MNSTRAKLVEMSLGEKSVESRLLIDDILAEHKDVSGNPRTILLSLLRAVQERLGFIPAEIFTEIEVRLGIPRHLIYSMASFYDDFRFDRPAEHVIRICDGAACELAACRDLVSTFSRELGIRPGEVASDGCFRLEMVNCLGHCSVCPAVRIDELVFGRVTESEASWLLHAVRNGGETGLAELRKRAARYDEFPKAAPGEQRRLLGTQSLSLTEVEAWEAAGGFSKLRRLVGRAAPAELVSIVKESGLRGLGGAGFPVGKKWELATTNPPPRILVCNADESEPGTFKDRFLLRHRPLLILEGMVLAGYAIGADRGILYMRSDYAYLRPVLDKGLQTMTAAGLLGENIAGSPFSMQIDIYMGAGAYICGEESALLESIEGKRAEPRLRPPFPVQSGLFGRPTVVNNVETLAYVPRILENGAAWFRKTGTADSAGTKLFSLSGDVARPGIFEMPLGTRLSELIEGPGGGMTGEFGFAIVGGAAGRVFAADKLDCPLDFAHQVGNGSVMALNAGRAPIEIAANILRFFSRETCGGCLPCRVGVPEACALVQSAAATGLSTQQRESFNLLSDCLETTARCGLGKTAFRASKELINLER